MQSEPDTDWVGSQMCGDDDTGREKPVDPATLDRVASDAGLWRGGYRDEDEPVEGGDAAAGNAAGGATPAVPGAQAAATAANKSAEATAAQGGSR